MLLIPKETMKKEDLEHRKHRMVLITKKRLPDVHSHARYWGFVEEAPLHHHHHLLHRA